MNAPNVLQVSVSQQHWAKPMEQLLSSTLVSSTLDHIAAAADQGSDIILFPEANLTGYDFPYLLQLDPGRVAEALDKVRVSGTRLITSRSAPRRGPAVPLLLCEVAKPLRYEARAELRACPHTVRRAAGD